MCGRRRALAATSHREGVRANCGNFHDLGVYQDAEVTRCRERAGRRNRQASGGRTGNSRT